MDLTRDTMPDGTDQAMEDCGYHVVDGVPAVFWALCRAGAEWPEAYCKAGYDLATLLREALELEIEAGTHDTALKALEGTSLADWRSSLGLPVRGLDERERRPEEILLAQLEWGHKQRLTAFIAAVGAGELPLGPSGTALLRWYGAALPQCVALLPAEYRGRFLIGVIDRGRL